MYQFKNINTVLFINSYVSGKNKQTNQNKNKNHIELTSQIFNTYAIFVFFLTKWK